MENFNPISSTQITNDDGTSIVVLSEVKKTNLLLQNLVTKCLLQNHLLSPNRLKYIIT